MHFFILAIVPLSGFPQSSSPNKPEANFWEYAKTTTVHDAKHMFDLGISFIQAPLHFDRQDWSYASFSVASTSALFLVDPSVKIFALKSRSGLNDKIFKIEDYLNGSQGTYAAAGIYLTGFFFKEERLRLVGLYAIETLFFTRSITHLLKYFFGRRRPYAGQDHMNFKAFRGKKQKYKSFPSGHTTGAFAFAGIMAMSVNNLAWKIGWYGSAAMVGFARIYHNEHWVSDTFLAGAISYSVASYVVNFENRQKERKFNSNFSIFLSPNGITAKFQF